MLIPLISALSYKKLGKWAKKAEFIALTGDF
jgi:hypothetical protein